MCGWGPTASTSFPSSPDEGGFPPGRDGAKRVPGVAGDQAKLRGPGLQLALDIAVGFARGLVALDAIRAEAALEQSNNSAVLKLARLDVQQIVGEREETEAGAAKLVQRCRDFRMRRHRRELVGQFLFVGVLDS